MTSNSVETKSNQLKKIPFQSSIIVPQSFKDECNSIRKELEKDKKRRNWKSCATITIVHDDSLYIKNMKAGKHHAWKWDDVSYGPLHQYIRRHLPIPDVCAFCRNPPKHLANITGIYNRDFKNWLYLCALCHKRYDMNK